MAKTHKTIIGEIKGICENFDPISEEIQSIVNKQLGYAFTV